MNCDMGDITLVQEGLSYRNLPKIISPFFREVSQGSRV